MRELKQLVAVAVAAAFFAGERFLVVIETSRGWVVRAATDSTHGRHAQTA
jgi:hypothetical protein